MYNFQNMQNDMEKMLAICAQLTEFKKSIDEVMDKLDESDGKNVETKKASGLKTEVSKMDAAEEQADEDARLYANNFAYEELNDMEGFLQLLEEQARRSILFANIDMDVVRKVIYNPVKAEFFDKNQRLKKEYTEMFLTEYAERMKKQDKFCWFEEE